MCVNQKILYYNRWLVSEKFKGSLILDRTNENLAYIKSLVTDFGGVASFIQCGKCIECKSKKSLEWSLRLLAEYEMHPQNCYFITLTYDDLHLKNENVNSHDLRLFIDNLYNRGFRSKYYACGEYGSQSLRPHYHLILWLDKPINDLIRYDNNLFTSELIDSIWCNRGQCKIGFVDIGSIMYVAGYVNKKLTKTLDLDLVPEFQRFSKGLGLDYFNKHYKEMLKDDKIYFNGKAYGLPRYYSKLLKARFPKEFNILNKKRLKENFELFNLNNKSDRDIHLSQLQKEVVLKRIAEFKKDRNLD